MNTALRESIMLAAMEGDLPRLLALGRDGLGRPLLLGDETLNVLGWSGPPSMPEDAAWEDYIREHLAPAFHWSDDQLRTSRIPLSHGFFVCRMSHPKEPDHWVTDIDSPSGKTLHLTLSDRDGPGLPPPDSELLGLLCLAIRSCVSTGDSAEPHEQLSAERLMLRLIRSQKMDEPLLRHQSHMLGLDTEGLFSLLILDLKGYHPHHSSIATIRSRLDRITGGRSAIDGEHLTFLLTFDSEESTEQEQLCTQLEEILANNKLFGVLSRTFYRLDELHRHYVHTLDVLKLRFCTAGDRYLVSSEELSVYAMIAALRERDDTIFPPHPLILRLLRCDGDRKTAYAETLFAYLRNAQKPMPTCGELHIHRNTLDYRLRRIEELTGLDWGDGELLFRLYFSLCTLRYDRLTGAYPRP